MKHFIYPAIFFVLCLAAGCKKEKADQKPIPPAGDYFPLSANTYWNYQPANDVTGITSFAENKGITSTVNGKTYAVLNYTPDNRIGNLFEGSLFRKENGKYYQALTGKQLIYPVDEQQILEFVFMEDNAPVGAQWESSVTGRFNFSNGSIVLQQTFTGFISEYLQEFKIDNTTFKDVVKVTMYMTTRAVDPASNFTDSEYYEKWYARNIGLIKTIHYPFPWATKVTEYKVR
jgi:hypothetical protein